VAQENRHVPGAAQEGRGQLESQDRRNREVGEAHELKPEGVKMAGFGGCLLGEECETQIKAGGLHEGNRSV
jgi:hypothetical protein